MIFRLDPKKFSDYTPDPDLDGSEIVPMLKNGENSTTTAQDIADLGGGGGGGAVNSVNGQTGTVVLDADDLAEGASHKFLTVAERTKLSNTSGTNTGDQDLSGLQPKDADLTTIAAIDSTQSGVMATDGSGWIRKTYAALKTALSLTKSDVGLSNVDNTSDANKPVSTAQQTALDGKQNLDADLTAIAALDSSTAGAIANDGAGWIKKTYAQFKTALSLVKGDVGLGNVDNTADANKPVSTAQAAAIAVVQSDIDTHEANTSNPHSVTKAQVGLGSVTNDAQLKAADLDTDGTLAANSDSKVPSQKAVKTYADQLIASADAMVFKGVIDASANPNYPAADKGHTYRISVAGKIGGASGVNVEIGDLILCLVDGSAAGTQAAVGANWSIAQSNIDGAVVGPASASDGTPAVFDGATGKLIKNVSFASFKSSLSLVKGDVGLSNVDNTADASKSVASAAVLTTARNIDGQSFDGSANITVIAPGTHAATSKATPVDADEVPLVDSAASNVLKRLTWANLKATVKTYFDTIYQPLDSDLTTIAGLTATTDNFMVATASAWASRTPSQARTQLGLGSLATLSSVDLTANVTGVLPIANGGTNSSTAAGAFSNLKQDATTSATGVVELATTAETDTGTDTTRAVTPDGLSGSVYGTKAVSIQVLDGATALTTGDAKAYLRIPTALNGMDLISCSIAVIAKSTSGTPTVQLARGRQANATTAHAFTDMLSTKITIDANEFDSKDAATAAVIDTANDDVLTGDLIRVDVDVAGTGTTGLFVTMAFRTP